jgi:hypothetical protein
MLIGAALALGFPTPARACSKKRGDPGSVGGYRAMNEREAIKVMITF